VTASTVFTLAEKTGWGVEYIMWEVPIALLNQATHVFLWCAGVKTKRAGKSKAEKLEGLAKLIGIDS
jgi:hypothetical protein